MPSDFLATIRSDVPDVRNRSLARLCRDLSADDLVDACSELDRFRRASHNLYEQVRALFFLSGIYRYHLPPKLPSSAFGLIPFDGYEHFLNRRFGEAIDVFLTAIEHQGVNDTLASGLAAVYHELGFQTLANQVRKSVRSV